MEGASGDERLVGLQLQPLPAANASAPAPGAVPVAEARAVRLWDVLVAAGAAGGEGVLAMGAAARGAAGGLLALSAQALHSGGGGSARAVVLGDDSLIIKYMNPHVVALLVGPGGAVETAFERARARARAVAAPAAAARPPPQRREDASAALRLLLVDSVTGEVLHTRRYAGATGPAALVVGDNWLAHTYWNALARRPEVASAVLLEGAVDRCAGERAGGTLPPCVSPLGPPPAGRSSCPGRSPPTCTRARPRSPCPRTGPRRPSSCTAPSSFRS